MKNKLPRRQFLINSLLATGGIALMDPMAAMASKRQKRYSICDIRNNPYGKQIEIAGKIFDGSGNTPLSAVTIEFWHLSPNAKSIHHQGFLTTDNDGNYILKSDYPGKEFGKATTIHFRVAKDQSQYETELTISDFDAFISGKHWEENHQLGDALLFPKHEQQDLKTKVNFNISLNI